MIGSEIQAGSLITVHQRTVHGRARRGEVLAVLGPEECPRYRVRWEDGTVSVFAQSEYATVDSVVSAPVQQAHPEL